MGLETMHPQRLAGAALLLLATTLTLAAEPATTPASLIGTWRVTALRTMSDGKTRMPLGEHPAGYVTILPSRLWLLLVDSTRSVPAAAALTDAEAVAAMKSHVSWTGTYVTGEQAPGGLQLTAQVDTASSEALNHTQRTYFMRRSGDRLVMTSPGVVVPMTGALSTVELELVRAD